MKDILKRLMRKRYGSYEEIYLKAVQDKVHKWSNDYKTRIACLSRCDDRIKKYHVGSPWVEVNTLKVKVRFILTL